MSIDWTKPIETKDGRPARCICTDRVFYRWTHVVLVMTDGAEDFVSCDADGNSVAHGKAFIRNKEVGP